MTTVTEPTYYDVLNVSPQADAGEIKAAYYRLVKTHSNEQDPFVFQQLTEAFQTLRDEARREVYDRSLNTDLYYHKALELVEAYGRSGQPKKQLELYEVLLANYPNDETVLSSFSQFLLFYEHPDKAHPLIQRGLSVSRGDMRFHFRELLVQALTGMREFDEALTEINRLLLDQPSSTNFQMKAKIQFLLGEREAAVRTLEKGLERADTVYTRLPLLAVMLLCFAFDERFDDYREVKQKIQNEANRENDREFILQYMVEVIQDLPDETYILENMIAFAEGLNVEESSEFKGKFAEERRRLRKYLAYYRESVPVEQDPPIYFTSSTAEPPKKEIMKGSLAAAFFLGIVFLFLFTPVVGLIAGFVGYIYPRAARITLQVVGVVLILLLFYVLI
ncbi:J domain-containing protein [Alkalicoccus urumqiensis]|uniref:J domain-containing protein n=1 Tax=Alkalicoccus urumqiensis TaxID=1548213 RepID=UPI0015E5D1E6|nr:J domain-containing protein [Alkalicoccus urumqiensis]